MTLIRSNRTKTVYSLLFVLLATTAPAEARRIVRIGSFGGGGESITLVQDLPDRAPFVRESKFFDVGWLNSDTRSGYVIYHGDKFTALDDGSIAELTRELGFDPTAKHRADHAEEQAAIAKKAAEERAHKEKRIASGLMIERKPGESSESYKARTAAFIKQHGGGQRPVSASPSASEMSSSRGSADVAAVEAQGSGFGMAGLVSLMGLAALAWIGRKSLGSRKKQTAETVAPQPSDAPVIELDVESFDAKVARRLAQLSSGDTTSELNQTAPIPQLRGFGRKAI